jgi:hypothetical protein
MTRHDPFCSLSPTPEAQSPAPEPAPPGHKGKGKTKLPPLLRELIGVSDESLAFLTGRPDQQPGDYERNLQRVAKIRAEFPAFCAARPQFSNWRHAWAAYAASLQLQRQALNIVSVNFAPSVEKLVPVVEALLSPRVQPSPRPVPRWLQRARQRPMRTFCA